MHLIIQWMVASIWLLHVDRWMGSVAHMSLRIHWMTLVWYITGWCHVSIAHFTSHLSIINPCNDSYNIKKEKNITPGGTRTRNPLLRRQMPYPLGHGGYAFITL